MSVSLRFRVQGSQSSFAIRDTAAETEARGAIRVHAGLNEGHNRDAYFLRGWVEGFPDVAGEEVEVTHVPEDVAVFDVEAEKDLLDDPAAVLVPPRRRDVHHVEAGAVRVRAGFERKAGELEWVALVEGPAHVTTVLHRYVVAAAHPAADRVGCWR